MLSDELLVHSNQSFVIFTCYVIS